MPSSTWDNLADEKRERVLAAARAEFARRGFEAGSLNTIASEAGIAKGSLFQYFSDKVDLIDTVVRDNTARVARMTVGQVALEGNLFDVLDVLVVRWLDYFESDADALGITVASGMETDPSVRRRSREASREGFRATLLPLIERSIASGELRPDSDPDQVLSMIVMVLRHIRLAAFEPGYDPGLQWADDANGRHHTARRYVDVLRSAFTNGERSPSPAD